MDKELIEKLRAALQGGLDALASAVKFADMAVIHHYRAGKFIAELIKVRDPKTSMAEFWDALALEAGVGKTTLKDAHRLATHYHSEEALAGLGLTEAKILAGIVKEKTAKPKVVEPTPEPVEFIKEEVKPTPEPVDPIKLEVIEEEVKDLTLDVLQRIKTRLVGLQVGEDHLDALRAVRDEAIKLLDSVSSRRAA